MNTDEITFIENSPGFIALNLSWHRSSLFAPLMSTESFIVSISYCIEYCYCIKSIEFIIVFK